VTKAKIHAEFKALDELKKKTIIMVTHDVQEAFELGNRICLMDAGKIVQQGTPAELLFKPKNKFVRNFLQEQRLQLELKAVLLQDIKQEISGFESSETVWSVMEKLKSNGNQSQEFEQLMTAFYQYKQHQTHE
jgi:osmoprotectant transport system ATP-binding protein